MPKSKGKKGLPEGPGRLRAAVSGNQEPARALSTESSKLLPTGFGNLLNCAIQYDTILQYNNTIQYNTILRDFVSLVRLVHTKTTLPYLFPGHRNGWLC